MQYWPCTSCSGGVGGRAGTLQIWYQERAFPSLRARWPQSGKFSRKKQKQKNPQKNKHPKKPTLVLTPGRNSVHYFRHIPQGSRRNVGEGKKSFGASSHRTKRFHPRARPFPALGRGRGLTPLRSPRPPQRGPATPSRLHLTLRKAGAASCCPRRTRTFSLRDSETRRV